MGVDETMDLLDPRRAHPGSHRGGINQSSGQVGIGVHPAEAALIP